MSDQVMNITDTLKHIRKNIDGKEMTLEELVKSLNHRGFGPLLMAPALIIVMPTGAIPGMPTLCALLICLLAGQIVCGRRNPWIPRRLAKISFGADKFDSAFNTVKKITRKVDALTHPHRLEFLTREASKIIVAVISILLALTMIPLELFPFASMFPALAILFFALGLSAKDGLFIAIGFAIIPLSALAIIYMNAGQ